MQRISIIIIAFVGLVLNCSAQAAYHVISECDTTVKAKLNSLSLGSRDVKLIVYDYPSTDADGKDVTVSGVIMIPADIVDGSVPCDGVVLYNHYTIGSPKDAPSLGEEGLTAVSAMLSNPLKPK